jgi:hypothetical protein
LVVISTAGDITVTGLDTFLYNHSTTRVYVLDGGGMGEAGHLRGYEGAAELGGRAISANWNVVTEPHCPKGLAQKSALREHRVWALRGLQCSCVAAATWHTCSKDHVLECTLDDRKGWVARILSQPIFCFGVLLNSCK